MRYICKMKDSLRILQTLLLVTIYGLAVSAATHPTALTFLENKQTEKGQYITVSTNLFSHTAPTTSALNSFIGNFSVPDLNNLVEEQWLITESFNQLYKTEFSQYLYNSVNFPIAHRKANIIFPFHSFW